MKFDTYSDTITAIATAPGRAGISVIRISGEKTFTIVDKIFIGKTKPSRAKTHTIHYGRVINPLNGQMLDEVLVAIFRKPNSYTGEDMVEISCHGGNYAASQILKLITNNGARSADPGEFTRRRVIAGKMDIIQAEAIIDLISADNESSYRSAIRNMQGILSTYISNLSNDLKNIISELEYILEFNESDKKFKSRLAQVRKKTKSVRTNLEKIIRTNENLRFLRTGVYCVIIGKPNVGKSSLFNRLIENNKSIVTEIPGTTRDSLQETIILDDITFHMIDTAGLKTIRHPKQSQKIEAIGIEKTKDWLKSADLIIAVFDNGHGLTRQDQTVYDVVKHRPHLLVLNKIDRPARFNKTLFQRKKIFSISAKYNQGIERLKKEMVQYYTKKITRPNNYLALNRRHLDILNQVVDFISCSEQEKFLETAIIYLRKAIDTLGVIQGSAVNEQILDTIFNRFCIGK